MNSSPHIFMSIFSDCIYYSGRKYIFRYRCRL